MLFLPGLSSAHDASLEVSEQELRVATERPAHRLRMALESKVDVASCQARWSKRTQELTVRLRKSVSFSCRLSMAHLSQLS